MIGHLRLAGIVIAWVWALAGILYAERAPLPPDRLAEESELVLTGRILALEVGVERPHVEGGFGNYTEAQRVTGYRGFTCEVSPAQVPPIM